ncbi:MAG TPA: signal peptide peptidase SppA [Candidatus Nanoarchaeia archaeon]|nr:signal peptide peptidase SppA [Candidatus Nanoarchaeia archaeon]
MAKEVKRSWWKWVLIPLGVFLFFVVVLPLVFSLIFFDGAQLTGNVALIPISGVIMTEESGSYFSSEVASSSEIVKSLHEAGENSQIKAIVLEINSPGGSAVASDEIGSAVKKAKLKKPVVAVIRDAGASGGYWAASAADYVIANRMSITGSIGVLSSYLEFSGLMEQYGVTYEKLTAGKYKDMGNPFEKLDAEKKEIIQKKLGKIHNFFIEEIAVNRKLPLEKVKEIATGEFFLGVEAKELGLVDELGDISTAETYLKQRLGLASIEYRRYQEEPSFLELLSSVFSDSSFKIGQGIGSVFVQEEQGMLLK